MNHSTPSRRMLPHRCAKRTALSHSLGALAACLVGIAEFVLFQDMNRVKLTALDFEVVVGALTFTG